MQVNQKINFAGVEGKVVELSPHASFVVVRLTNRITIVGTTNNQFNWEEMPDVSSGFDSFITYMGVRSIPEGEKVLRIVAQVGGYTYRNESQARKAKRIKDFPLEVKIRGLTPDYIAQVITNQKKVM